MNYNELKQLTFELIDKLNSSDIDAVTIEFEQAKVQLSKNTSCVNPKAFEKAAANAALIEKTIHSPMVGTYYAAPTPESAPFVEIGDKICKGDTICIIEAMKLMNEIEADKDGIVKEILVVNGELVEYNQPIIVVE